jgi:DNA-binding MarR family transcriptional regulator
MRHPFPAPARSKPDKWDVKLRFAVLCNTCSVQVSDDEIVDAVLRASRVLVAVAARSLAAIDQDVTLPQYRALVVLASRGPQRPSALADALAVHPSTITRLCDRLVAKRLVRRTESAVSRREVVIELAPKGRRLVDAVTARRRAEISAVVANVPERGRSATVRALHALGDAAAEPSDAAWFLGDQP